MPDLDDEYEIDSKIPNRGEIQAGYARASEEAARLHPNATLDVSYGPDPRQKLDVFPAASPGSPAILFFHGGYWTGGAKESRRFPASTWNTLGVSWISVEYRLTPAVTLDDVVEDARAAVAWFHRNAAHYGCDPSAPHVSGNSAGGHLAAMIGAPSWQASHGLPPVAVKSVTAISGLFELEPLRTTFVNEWLRLDASSSRRNSPIYTPPPPGTPVVVSWGGRESSEFARQSRDYAAACRNSGCSVDEIERPPADHLSIIGELSDPQSPLFKAVRRTVVRP